MALHGQEIDGVLVLGPIDDVATRIRARHSRRHHRHAEARPSRVASSRGGVEGSVESIHLAPDVSGLTTAGVETQDLDGSSRCRALNLARPWSHSSSARRRRRCRARRDRAFSRARGSPVRAVRDGRTGLFVQELG
jgi:hypothetical protein